MLVLGSAGQPSLALPAPGGGPLGGLCAADAGAFAGVRRPRQSYELASGAAVSAIPHAGLLVSQRLAGVVRCVPRVHPVPSTARSEGRFLPPSTEAAVRVGCRADTPTGRHADAPAFAPAWYAQPM